MLENYGATLLTQWKVVNTFAPIIADLDPRKHAHTHIHTHTDMRSPDWFRSLVDTTVDNMHGHALVLYIYRERDPHSGTTA